MLEIRNLKKVYRTKEGFVEALAGVSLSVEPGEIVGLFGENGAGKTTLLKSIPGYQSYEGEILLDGKKIDRSNLFRLSFATCEHSFFENLTPGEHREFYEMNFSRFREKRFRALMEFFNLPENRPLRRFSTGQKNQFETIMALCQGAEYILMDEPFAGSDLFNREDFYKVLLGILEPEETVILSTHLAAEVDSFVSRALVLRNGRLVGDVSCAELEERGQGLVDYIKDCYQYRFDRVGLALEKLTSQG